MCIDDADACSLSPSSASSRSHQRRVLIHILIYIFCSCNVLCKMFLHFFVYSTKLKPNTCISGQSRGSSLQSVLGVGWYCSLFVSWIMELWSWLIAQSAVIPTPTRTNSKLSNFKTKAGEFVKLLKIPAAAAEKSSAAESGMWFLIPLPLVAWYPAYPLLPTPTTAEVVLIPVPGSNHQYSIVALLEIH